MEVEELSCITSRCGNVTIMGLGLLLIGLLFLGAAVGAGQIWEEHQALQDAMINAASVMDANHEVTAGRFISLVQENGGFSTFRLTSFGTQNQGSVLTIQASGMAPLNLWFWPSWMGRAPAMLIASVS